MFLRRSGWTLIELLVAMAILALLSALLFPAFVSARGAAQKAVCVLHFKQIAEGTIGYLNDYDDVFTPVSQNPSDAVIPGLTPNPGDHTWVQLLLPYTTSFSLFVCPSDYTREASGLDVFDKDIVPGDLYARYHEASMRVNAGFNFMALSPIVREGIGWFDMPLSYTGVSSPSTTIMFLDSAHHVSKDGVPSGGGSWLVNPPCRYREANGVKQDMFASNGYSFDKIFSEGPWSYTTGLPYGGAFPWHSGHLTMGMADGSVREVSPGYLTENCNPSTQTLEGSNAPGSYLWSSTTN